MSCKAVKEHDGFQFSLSSCLKTGLLEHLNFDYYDYFTSLEIDFYYFVS